MLKDRNRAMFDVDASTLCGSSGLAIKKCRVCSSSTPKTALFESAKVQLRTFLPR